MVLALLAGKLRLPKSSFCLRSANVLLRVTIIPPPTVYFDIIACKSFVDRLYVRGTPRPFGFAFVSLLSCNFKIAFSKSVGSFLTILRTT